MKLTSLYIDDYKLLKKFNIDFEKDISILIGINGSGKSSVLEVIAQIFSDAFLNQQSKFGFKLIYELQLEEVLEQTATTSEFRTDYIKVEISASNKNEELSYKVFVEDKIIVDKENIEKRFNNFQKILPSNIVIYYSGLSEIMKKICEPHDQILSKNYREGNINIIRPFFYFEPALFEIILISLLSYEFGDVPIYLKERAKIKKIESVTIRLKKPAWAKGKITNWWGADGKVKDFLDFLASISIPLNDKKVHSTERFGNVVIETWQDEYLIITIIGQEKLFEIREYFVEEKELFKILNTLYIDGLWAGAKFNFIKDEDIEKNKFSVLSEGEQQAIIIKGLTELVKDENSLFLFDEPDNYLHPSWQEHLLADLSIYKEKTHFLVTTHSPQLLTNATPNYSEVFILSSGILIDDIPNYFGKDVNNILYNLMNSRYRNEDINNKLNFLFKSIALLNVDQSEQLYEELIKTLGEDDPKMIAAKTEIDFLKFEEDEIDSEE